MRSILFLLAFFASTSAVAEILAVDRIVAVVNEDVILESEVNNRLRTVRGQLAQRNTKPPSEQVLRTQVLERLILSRLQLQAAARTGIRIDDRALNAAISRIGQQNNLSLAQFRAALEADGFDFEVFREDIRNEMTISRLLQRRVRQRIDISDQEIDNFLSTNKTQASANNEYRLSHILIALPEAAAAERIEAAKAKADNVVNQLRNGASFKQVAASNSDGQKAFEGGDLGWRKTAELPSLFSDTVLQMNIGDTSDPIRSPSGFHVIQLADKRGDIQRHVVKQTLARHILIRQNELTSNEDAQTRLQQLLIRLEGGEDFGDLARAHSDDRGSAAKGGELGWSSPGKLVPKFQAEMDKLTKGQISQPFRTQFGWHVVQVLDRRDYDDTEQFLRAKARKFITKRRTEEETQTFLRRLRDEAFVEYRLNDL